MQSQGSITRWITELGNGDAAAAQGLWETYFRRMVELARQRLQHAPRRAADEEDVALSAFNSFCTRVQAGLFPRLRARDHLWPLLVAITAHKCVDLVRHETRQKRQQGERIPLDLVDLICHEPTPDFAAQVADQLKHLLDRLDATGDPELRPIALARMEGASPTEIATQLGCVRRTVERKLQLIGRVWEQEVEA